jgi:tetratricopeptide (TPR) repeat protein
MDTFNRLQDTMEGVSVLPSLTVAQLRDVGEAALRGNHYKEAIRAFDEGLGKAKAQNSNKSRLASLNLLDLRVEARLRRNKYDRARKDAEAMIRIDRTDARGYIRLGQIKRLKGDRTAALKAYSTGLKHVPTSHPLRHVLKTKHENTIRAITQSKPTDPVAVLPMELLQMVLYHFN